MISKFIIKTNEWYENLSDLKGGLLYLGLVFIPYFLIDLITISLASSVTLTALLPMLWILLVISWRMSFKLLKNKIK